jgi:hypothetical protein
MMTLVPNWRAVLSRAWSAWLLYIVIAINAADLLVYWFGSALPGPLWARAGVTILVSSLGLYARLVLQPKLSKAAGE